MDADADAHLVKTMDVKPKVFTQEQPKNTQGEKKERECGINASVAIMSSITTSVLMRSTSMVLGRHKLKKKIIVLLVAW